MKKLKLGGKYAQYSLVDDEDYEQLIIYHWNCNKRGYAARLEYIRGSGHKNQRARNFLIHRVVMNITDPAIKLDHINGNRLDNRKENLRIATISQNGMNKRMQSNNTSGYKGVFLSYVSTLYNLKKPWQARIWLNGKGKHLGYFATKEEAARAYNIAALKYFGEFAKLNLV